MSQKPPSLTPRQQEQKGQDLRRQEEQNKERQRAWQNKNDADMQTVKETLQRQMFSMTKTAKQQLDITRRTRSRSHRCRSYTFLSDVWWNRKKPFLSKCCKKPAYARREASVNGYVEAYFVCRECKDDCEILYYREL